MPRPIREQMQGRPSAARYIAHHATGKVRFGCKQPAQSVDLALLERCRELDGDRFVALQRAVGHITRSWSLAKRAADRLPFRRFDVSAIRLRVDGMSHVVAIRQQPERDYGNDPKIR